MEQENSPRVRENRVCPDDTNQRRKNIRYAHRPHHRHPPGRRTAPPLHAGGLRRPAFPKSGDNAATTSRRLATCAVAVGITCTGRLESAIPHDSFGPPGEFEPLFAVEPPRLEYSVCTDWVYSPQIRRRQHWPPPGRACWVSIRRLVPKALLISVTVARNQVSQPGRSSSSKPSRLCQ